MTESAVYRTSRNIDQAIAYYTGKGEDKGRDTMEAFNHFQIEAAAMKVFGSEALDYVVDEMVQIHGGMGFSAEMPADRAYRDSRINRIFEGTNEINRLLLVDALLKRAAKGVLPIMDLAQTALDEIAAFREGAREESGDYFDDKYKAIRDLKKVALVLMKAVSEKFTRQLVFEQEILNNISDIAMLVYAAESLLLRVRKLETVKGEEHIRVYRDILDVYVYDAAARIAKMARDAVFSFAYGDLRETLLKGIRIFTEPGGVNVREARRRIADTLIEENGYCF